MIPSRAALITALALSSAPALAQTAPTLRPEITVGAELVRIGDVIDNAGRFSEVAIFRAPDMGTTGAVPAWRIVEQAARAGLSGIDTRGHSEVIVTRDARIVPMVDMEERIATSVARTIGVTDAARIQVTFDREVRPIAVEPTARGDVLVSRLVHDPRSGRFEAFLEVVGSPSARRTGGVRVSGQAVEMTEFLVLARSVGRGEVIRASDLVPQRRARNEAGGLAADIVVAPTQAVGMAPRRPLSEGSAFRAADLMRPEIVEKNANVLITFELPGLALTARGRAMEAGAEGDVIQVQNIQTRKTMNGVVTGANRVAIQASPRPVAIVNTQSNSETR
ncbi:MAG: flagellar basal body P-ring formation chaperone FlgA [Alphaproteobacteria bacterium]